jgi:hypothetical protein
MCLRRRAAQQRAVPPRKNRQVCQKEKKEEKVLNVLFCSCGRPCGQLLECGRHKCGAPCHRHEPAPQFERGCQQSCGATLDCGYKQKKGKICRFVWNIFFCCRHACLSQCHSGPCASVVCERRIELHCACGRQVLFVLFLCFVCFGLKSGWCFSESGRCLRAAARRRGAADGGARGARDVAV